MLMAKGRKKAVELLKALHSLLCGGVYKHSEQEETSRDLKGTKRQNRTRLCSAVECFPSKIFMQLEISVPDSVSN